MNESSSTEPIEASRQLKRAKLVFIASILAIPTCYGIATGLSGENHFGQGLKGSLFWTVLWLVQGLSFFGCVLSPCMVDQSERRQSLFMALGLAAFLLDQLISLLFIVFDNFPD
jgi:hypothetical protein